MEKVEEIIKDGTKWNKIEWFRNKTLQSGIPLGLEKDGYVWLRRNTDPRKTAAIFLSKSKW